MTFGARVARRTVALAALVGLASSVASAVSDVRTIEIDRCIGGKCRNGRYRAVTVTPEYFIVRIDPNRCPTAPAYHCPSRYDRFTTEDGTEVRVDGYKPGTKSAKMFTVYVPRGHTALHIEGINKRKDHDVLDLRRYVEGAEVREEGAAADDAKPPPAED